MALRSIAAILADNAARAPDRPAITFQDETLTRGELDRRANRLAREFQNRGVQRGDFVTIALPNGFQFYETAIACWKIGATPQPVSARLPAFERDAIVELANPKLLVGASSPAIPPERTVPLGFTPDPSLSNAPLPDILPVSWKAMTSGGSTGRPKLIVAGDPGEFDPELEVLPYQMRLDETQLVPGPLYHNGPFAFSMLGLFFGHHLVVMPRFDAEAALQLIERYRVNWIMSVPTMLLRIWRLDEAVRDQYDLSSLRILAHVAAPCPAWLKRELIGWLGPDVIHELYGGTEGQGATWITGSEWLAHPGSVGKPFAGFSMKIVGEDGRDLPPGEVGEVYMLPDRGQGVTYRYIGATPRAIEGGWESLGDMGYMDEDGFLYLSDRRADMILRGGANIYPAEVEAAIEAHPCVRSSVVIGLPDEDLGNRIHALVDATEPVSEAELLDFLKDRLVVYKLPQSVEFVFEPLRDDAGKARRSQLRADRIAKTS